MSTLTLFRFIDNPLLKKEDLLSGSASIREKVAPKIVKIMAELCIAEYTGTPGKKNTMMLAKTRTNPLLLLTPPTAIHLLVSHMKY